MSNLPNGCIKQNLTVTFASEATLSFRLNGELCESLASKGLTEDFHLGVAQFDVFSLGTIF